MRRRRWSASGIYGVRRSGRALLETAEAEPGALYADVSPILPLGLPFVETAVSENWFDWPALPDLFPVSFPGVKTSRDGFLVDTDLDRLKARIADYFDPALSHEEIARRYLAAMNTTARFDARAVREALLARGGPNEDGFVRFAYRPFDNRWLYWEADTKLLDEKRADYQPHVFEGNLWLVTQQKPRREWSPPQAVSHIGCIDLMDRSATCIPTWLRDDGIGSDGEDPRKPESWPPDHAARNVGSDDDGPYHPGSDPPPHPVRRVGSNDNSPRSHPNLSGPARRYLEQLGLSVEDLFHHVLAVLHDPAYREANAGALRMEWPRIPLPGWPTPGNGASGDGASGDGASADAGVRPVANRRSGAKGPPDPENAGIPPAGTAATTDRGNVFGPGNGASADGTSDDAGVRSVANRRSGAEGPPDLGTRALSPATERSPHAPGQGGRRSGGSARPIGRARPRAGPPSGFRQTRSGGHFRQPAPGDRGHRPCPRPRMGAT